VQDTLGQGLYDAMNGNFKNIADSFTQMINRMVAEALAADIARTLFGDLLKGGSGNGILGSLFSSASSFFGGFFADGGDPPVGRPSIVGERGPEWFIPRAAGTIVPMGKAQSGIQQNIAYHVSGNLDRRTQEQTAAISARRAQVAMLRGTA
jgi:hypothetical protein